MYDFSNARLKWNLPPYPPYHNGLYIEEYFYNYYKANRHMFDKTGYTLCPIFWTSAYLNNVNVQKYVDVLPKNKKYFCVSQHDDAIKEKLPEDTLIFAAGGNSGGIPLPLVCSSLAEEALEPTQQDIFCSFVGSNTHQVRDTMLRYLSNKKEYALHVGEWSWNIQDSKVKSYIEIMKRSKFTLCPRGYGAQSFRFYEALQLGSVPIYVHDDTIWQPYSSELKWSDFSVSINIKNISKIDEILSSISESERLKMVKAGKSAYINHFQLNKMPLKILNYLQKDHTV